ncbi:EAL domain-containing protein [Serratia fonticola]|uniref:EAL domain-containing protein n=1 Tax=Serratia fonticola TaxID=47917 RepID=UPI002DB8EBF1|nr:EAL domain-containing protein [Serratia fonticola]MEB7884031.1 EAL domain-containing protein [Serratia fonticola]
MAAMLSRGSRQPVWVNSRRAAWMCMVLICGVFWALVVVLVNVWLQADELSHVAILPALLLVASLLFSLWCPSLINAITRYRVRQLRRAMARGDIRAWYQPMVSGAQGQVSGCEVLARWHLPGGRIRGAERFIPLAEQHDLIVPMTSLLVRQACHDLAQMQILLPVGFDVSINLSAAHAGSTQFLQDCRRLQQVLASRAGRVTAEVGERAVLSQVPGGRQLLLSLREAGIRVMLDDFATGSQGLVELETLPVDGFKIDRRHVRDLPDGGPVPMAALMIHLARLMSLDVIAEGVENQAQHEWLLAQGIGQQQGYYFAPALQAHGLAQYLANDALIKGAIV